MQTCHGVSVEELYTEKIGSEETAGELQNSLDDFDSNRGQDEPILYVGEVSGLECVVDHNYELLTHNQVLKRWKRTPRTLKIRGVKVKVPRKTTRLTSVRYPFPTNATLKVRCRYGVQSSQQLIPSRAKQFSSGGSMLMDSTFKNMMEGTNVLSLFRLKKKNAVDKMVKAEDGAIGGSDDEAGDSASGSNEEGEESELAEETGGAASATPAFSMTGAGAKQRRVDKSTTAVPSSKASASGGNACAETVANDDSDSEIDDVIRDDLGTWAVTNTEAAHTTGYWIMEMPPEEAMLGCAQGKASFQINNLVKKEEASDNDKRRALQQMSLIENARKMREGACELLPDEEYTVAVKTIVAAGRRFPSRIRLTQVRRLLQLCDKDLREAGSDSRREFFVRLLLRLCEPWTIATTPDYDPYDALLSTAGVKPCQVVAFFATELFTQRLCEWMTRGEVYDSIVMAFVKKAIEAWSDLPEDSKMSSTATYTWDNGLD